MKNPGGIVQVALVAGALLAGILLDRFIQTARSSSSRENAVATSGSSANSPTKPSGDGTSSDSLSNISVSLSGAPTTARTFTSKASLDTILAQHDPQQRVRDLQAFISTIALSEYGDALKRIRQITNSNERELASRLLLTQWAQTDPDGALQFAAGNRGFEYVAEDVFQQLAAADFESAITRAQAIPGNDLRYRALRGALAFKADTDPRGALALAKTLGDFRDHESLASAIYRQWAAVDPQAAAMEAAGTDLPEEPWRSPVNSVVQTWAAQDPAAAAKWSLSLADTQTQTRSVSQVVREWSRQDPTAAANWIHTLESGAARDAAVAGLAQALAATDPQTALNWVGSIADETTRSRTLQRVSGIVMWRDPQNGPALLEAAGLPPDRIPRPRRGRDR
jgi:hypothetical protein